MRLGSMRIELRSAELMKACKWLRENYQVELKNFQSIEFHADMITQTIAYSLRDMLFEKI